MISMHIGNDWDVVLEKEFQEDYFVKLLAYLEREYETQTIYPVQEHLFEALKLTPYAKTRVVILGQDPYHEPGQAHGLAFSVPAGADYPPSLQNIIKECTSDIGRSVSVGKGDAEGVLEAWARQGVLLLNTVLSVRAHQAASHRDIGWEHFTDRIISLLAVKQTPIVFILWGAPAGKKKDLIREVSKEAGVRHLIITAPHPSPLSAYRGFWGGRYFSRANHFLQDTGQEPITW